MDRTLTEAGSNDDLITEAGSNDDLITELEFTKASSRLSKDAVPGPNKVSYPDRKHI